MALTKYKSAFKENNPYSGKGFGWGSESGISDDFLDSVQPALSSKYFKDNLVRLIFKSMDQVNSKGIDDAVSSSREVMYINGLLGVMKNRQSYNKIVKNILDAFEDTDEVVDILLSWNKLI